MLVSNGSLNGAPLNTIRVNGGGFMVPLEIRGSAALRGAALLTHRRALKGAGAIAVDGEALLTPRRAVAFRGQIEMEGVFRLTIRRPLAAHGTVAMPGAALITRRVVMRWRGTAALAGRVLVRWRDFGRQVASRRIVLDPQPRGLLVAADPRAIEVRRDPVQAPAPQTRKVTR